MTLPPPMPALRGRRVLMVYGLAGEANRLLAPMGFNYMGAQLRWLRSCGADARIVRTLTTAPVAENAARLAAAIRGGGRCLVVAHSKGGLEAVEALLDPEVAACCDGLLAFQAPFAGSPLANAALRRPVLQGLARWLARLLRAGDLGGLPDLTPEARAAWMKAHAAALEALLRRVPVLCVASTLEKGGPTGQDRLYLPLARWMQRRGQGPNDALVSVASALLPGARHLVLPGSHHSLVTTGLGRDPAGVLRRALPLLLSPDPSPSPATPLPSGS
jgi:hypothetical protein